MKQANPVQLRLSSLRQKSTIKWKQFADIYAKFLIRFPWPILALSSLISVGLTVCFLLFAQIRSFDQNDFVMHHAPATKNAGHIRRVFGNDTELRVHQQLNFYPALDVIIKRKLNTVETNDDITNMLNDEVIEEIRSLDKQIQSIRITNENKTMEYNYSSLCTKLNNACLIDGNYILTDKFRQDISHLLPSKTGYYIDTTGANGIPGFMFGKHYRLKNITVHVSDYDEGEDEEHDKLKSTTIAPLVEIISYVPVLRLRYSLSSETAEKRELSIRWEREALRYLNENYQSLVIDPLPSTSSAITDIIGKKAHEEGFYMSLMILIFLVLCCIFISIQGNTHTSVGYLPFCGILSIGFSTGATFGLLSLFRIQIIEPMALLVFIVAIIDFMRFSIVCGEYHRIVKEHTITITDISSEIDIGKILPAIIESTHPYFLISTLIITIVYSLFSILSPMSTTILICLTLVLYIIVNYIVHSTFFSSCLVITLKRLSSRRHSLFCVRLSNDYYTKTKKTSTKIKLIKDKLHSFVNNDSIIKKFIAGILCLLSIIFIVSSIWVGLSIDTRLFEDRFLPHDAQILRRHMQSQIDDFDIGPIIMFTIPEAIDYENVEIQTAMRSLLEQCLNETTTNAFRLFWLDHENINYMQMGKEPIELRVTPFSHNDLILTEGQNHSSLGASRFFCQYSSISGDRDDIRTMHNLYTYASQNAIRSIFPYSLLFSTYESLEQIRTEIFLLIILLVKCSFISTFIPFFSFKNSLAVGLHLLTLLTGTLACLYVFHHLTFNFADALWLYVISIIFLDTFIHSCYTKSNSKWKYNRIILALVISLLILYVFPIQSYVFQIIRDSLIYQSMICFILINLIFPSCYYLLQSVNKTEQINTVRQPTITTIEGHQSLTREIEIKTTTYESNTNMNSSI